MAGEADRQVAGVECAGPLLRVGEEAEARQVVGAGELVLAEGQFEGGEPLVPQALNRGALRRVVVGLARLLAPLVEVMHLLRLAEQRQVGVGDVVEDDREGGEDQQQDQQECAAQDSHDINIRVAILLWGSFMPIHMDDGKRP